MAVVDTINSIKTHLGDAYRSLADKQATIPQNKNIENLASSINSIPSGGGAEEAEIKDVNFFDYDGTCVKSYTASEFLNLTAFPDNPSHDGLIAQGWNWDFEDAKEQVRQMGVADIGQNYITDDGKTRVYINLGERLNPKMTLRVNGTVAIDWGDGSAIETITGTSVGSSITRQHTYPHAGKYVIKLELTAGTEYKFSGSNGYSQVLFYEEIANYTPTRGLLQCVEKIEIGNGMKALYQYCFYNCSNLKTITIPKELTSFGASQGCVFYNCYNLKYIVAPINISTILMQSTFYNCFSLKGFSFNKKIQTFNASVFTYCYSLKRMVIPYGFTSIGNTVFNNCYSLKNLFLPSTLTTIGTNSFSYAYSLGLTEIPEKITNIPTGAFQKNYGITYIKFPVGLTQIQSNAFADCSNALSFDFTACTNVPSLGNYNAFQYIYSDAKIIVPDSLYDTWKSATNWSNSAVVGHIIKESDWVR